MTPKIENNNYFKTHPKVAVSEDFLIMKVWHKKYDFEPQIASWIDKPDNHFVIKKKLESKTIILGWKE